MVHVLSRRKERCVLLALSYKFQCIRGTVYVDLQKWYVLVRSGKRISKGRERTLYSFSTSSFVEVRYSSSSSRVCIGTVTISLLSSSNCDQLLENTCVGYENSMLRVRERWRAVHSVRGYLMGDKGNGANAEWVL